MRSRSLPHFAVAFAIGLFAVTAGADEASDLAKGRYAYNAHSFDDADSAFHAMLDPKTGTLHDTVLVNEARMYWGATLLALGRKDEAVHQFEAILALDPKYEPDPAVFPVGVGYVFIDTRARFQERARQFEEEKAQREKLKKEQEEAAKKAMVERLKYLEKLAAEDTIVEPHSRWIALLPFGAGQFENGQTALGIFFAATEALLYAGALVTVPIYLAQLHDASAALAPGLFNEPIAQQYLDRANVARVTNLAFNGALGLAAIAGVVQAQAAFDPEVVRVRMRVHVPSPGAPARPAAVSALKLDAAPVSGPWGGGVSGAVLGVSGRF